MRQRKMGNLGTAMNAGARRSGRAQMNYCLSLTDHLLRQSPVRFTAFRILAILCALHVSGAHWLALQTAAWTGMLVSRSQSATVSEAVRTTFDGDHPCPLCQAVEEGQQREKDQESARLIEVLGNLNFI